MRRSLPTWLLVAACADPSRGVAVDRVVPDQGLEGQSQPVEIQGTFHLITNNVDRGDIVIAGVTATVGTMPLPDAMWLGQDRITATMPSLMEGTYDVTVSLDGRSDTLSRAYTISSPGGGDGGMASGKTRQIDVQGPVTGGPHADFPLLVDLVDASLRLTTMGGTVANAQGFDISFSLDAARTMPLSHEIENYDGIAGAVVAWVKIPSLDTGTSFFIHSGDPAITMSQENRPSVWSANYVGVWHLTDFADSTGPNTGADTNTSTVAGQIEEARAFNGSTSHISVPASATINNVFGSGGTVEAWMFVNSAGGGSLGRVFEKATIVRMGMCDGGGVANSLFFTHEFTGNPATWCTATGSMAPGTWIHVAVVYDNSSTANQPTMYINGIAQAKTQIDTPNGSAFSDAVGPLVIGDRAAGARAFDGRIDELRFARELRSGGWITTSYENQYTPRTFVSLGP